MGEMSEEKGIWGEGQFTFTRTDVDSLYWNIEHHGKSVAVLYDAQSWTDYSDKDAGLVVRWIEKILHLYCAGVSCDDAKELIFGNKLKQP